MSKRFKINPIWDHFTSQNENLATCNLCKKLVSYKSTIGNLKRHIQRNHPAVNLMYIDGNAERISNSDNVLVEPTTSVTIPVQHCPSPAPQVQATASNEVSTFFNTELTPNPVSKEKETSAVDSQSHTKVLKQPKITSIKKFSAKDQASIDQQLLKLFICDFQPFSIVEDSGFRAFVHALNPYYVLPNRKKISNYFIPAMYETCQSEIKMVLTNASKVTITTDCWTSKNNESFIAVTAHFILEAELKTILLSCHGMDAAHTYENLASEIKMVMAHWDITDKIVLVVSDNAANITAAIEQHLKLKHLGCAAHKLNLIVDAALKEPLVAEIISKVKTIVRYFRKSPKAFKLFSDNQIKEGIPTPKKLIMSVPTRWNSTYDMFHRFVELEIPLKTTLALTDKVLPIIAATEWVIMREVCLILEPFKKLTERLSSQKYPTASSLIVYIDGLLDVCFTSLNDADYAHFDSSVKSMIGTLIEEIQRRDRFGMLQQSRTLTMCTYLDPRYKDVAFGDPDNAKTIIKKKLIALIKKKLDEDTTKKMQNPDIQVEGTEEKKLDFLKSFRKAVQQKSPKGK